MLIGGLVFASNVAAFQGVASPPLPFHLYLAQHGWLLLVGIGIGILLVGWDRRQR